MALHAYLAVDGLVASAGMTGLFSVHQFLHMVSQASEEKQEVRP